MRLALALVFLLLTAAGSQAAVFATTTYAEPNEVTLNYDKFQKDAEGNYIRDSSGAYIRERQFITVHYDVRFECVPGTSPSASGQGSIFAAGETGFGGTAKGERVTYLALEPKEHIFDWAASGIEVGVWEANGSFEVDLLNDQIPQFDLHATVYWPAQSALDDDDVNGECYGTTYEQQFENANHTILIPGLDPVPDDIDSGTPDKTVPAPLGLLVVPALAAILRRR